MEIAASSLDANAAYKLLVGIVVPRPIAWVTTLSRGGLINAAPFSCYTFVCNDPPMLAINIGRREGALKDTARHIESEGEFVANVVTEDLVEVMHATSEECAQGVSEVERLKLSVCPSQVVRPPRLARSPVSLECRVEQILELGRLRNSLVLGRIVHFHIADDVCEAGKVDTEKLRPIARLGGRKYARLGSILTLPEAQLPQSSVSKNGG
jgi:flavin reductase (DIM6/NTAB) family NADH-FMN oxidoreductase RutF